MSGGRRKEEPPQPQLANGALKVSVWSKVLRSDAAWDDKVRKAREGGPALVFLAPAGRARPWEQGVGWRGCRRVVERAELLPSSSCSAGSGVISAS